MPPAPRAASGNPSQPATRRDPGSPPSFPFPLSRVGKRLCLSSHLLLTEGGRGSSVTAKAKSGSPFPWTRFLSGPIAASLVTASKSTLTRDRVRPLPLWEMPQASQGRPEALRPPQGRARVASPLQVGVGPGDPDSGPGEMSPSHPGFNRVPSAQTPWRMGPWRVTKSNQGKDVQRIEVQEGEG